MTKAFPYQRRQKGGHFPTNFYGGYGDTFFSLEKVELWFTRLSCQHKNIHLKNVGLCILPV